MTSPKFDENAKGVYAISATPFLDDGSLDLASTEKLISFYLSAKVDGIVVLGMMGEASKLSEQESSDFLSRVIDVVGGKVPVIAGVSNPGSDNLVRFSRNACEAGASGVMIAPIPGLKGDAQVSAYFNQICTGLGPDIPIVLQDFPLATNVHMSVDVINQLIADYPQVVMLKHEDWPGLNKLTALRKTAAEKGLRRISILTGNGGLHLPQEITRGADGAMTGFAYPEMLVAVCAAHLGGDPERAEDIFDVFLPLVRHESQPGAGLALRKEILRRRGAIASSYVRSPGPKLTADDHKDLDWLVKRIESRLELVAPGLI
jgi:4-hydroxy-tetrahydrodipicolinate synthase